MYMPDQAKSWRFPEQPSSSPKAPARVQRPTGHVRIRRLTVDGAGPHASC